MDHTTLNAALDKLKARGYTVTEVQYPEIRGTNDMDNPLVIVECPWYHRINTTPRMWAHLHAKEAKLASKNVYCYSCRFSFSEDHPQDVESLEKILQRRYEYLLGWANRLSTVKPNTNDSKRRMGRKK